MAPARALYDVNMKPLLSLDEVPPAETGRWLPLAQIFFGVPGTCCGNCVVVDVDVDVAVDVDVVVVVVVVVFDTPMVLWPVACGYL